MTYPYMQFTLINCNLPLFTVLCNLPWFSSGDRCLRSKHPLQRTSPRVLTWLYLTWCEGTERRCALKADPLKRLLSKFMGVWVYSTLPVPSSWKKGTKLVWNEKFRCVIGKETRRESWNDFAGVRPALQGGSEQCFIFIRILLGHPDFF